MNTLLYIFLACIALNSAYGYYVVKLDSLDKEDTDKVKIVQDMESGNYTITFSSDLINPNSRLQFINTDGDIYETIEGSLCDWEKENGPEADAANVLLDVLGSGDCIFTGNNVEYVGAAYVEASYATIAEIVAQNDGSAKAHTDIWDINDLLMTLELTFTTIE